MRAAVIDNAYRRFCTERFPLPTESQVAELEQRIGVVFPDDYRRFLLAYNGGCFNEPHIIPRNKECPLDRLTFMNGIGAAHPVAELATDRQLAIFDDNDPPQVIPIGYTIMGNLILLVPIPNEEVILLRTFRESFQLAETVEEFFELLHEPLYE